MTVVREQDGGIGANAVRKRRRLCDLPARSRRHRKELEHVGAQRDKGYSAREIIGRNFSVFYRDDDVRADEPAGSLAIARRREVRGRGWRVRKDGSRLWGSVVIDAVVRNASGTVVGFAKVVRDVTQRLAERPAALDNVSDQVRLTAEHDPTTAAIVCKDNRFSTMAEQMARIAYGQIDLPGNEVTWSDELYHMLDLPKSYRPELESAIESYHPDDPLRVKWCIERATLGGVPFTYEARIARADAYCDIIICSARVERADDGTITGIFGIWDWDMLANTILCDPMQHVLFGFDEGQLFPLFDAWTAPIHDDDRTRIVRSSRRPHRAASHIISSLGRFAEW